MRRCARQSTGKSASKCRRSTAPQFRWTSCTFLNHPLIVWWSDDWKRLTNIFQHSTCRRRSVQQLTSKNATRSATKSATQVNLGSSSAFWMSFDYNNQTYVQVRDNFFTCQCMYTPTHVPGGPCWHSKRVKYLQNMRNTVTMCQNRSATQLMRMSVPLSRFIFVQISTRLGIVHMSTKFIHSICSSNRKLC